MMTFVAVSAAALKAMAKIYGRHVLRIITMAVVVMTK
jgi:hypothetical protein